MSCPSRLVALLAVSLFALGCQQPGGPAGPSSLATPDAMSSHAGEGATLGGMAAGGNSDLARQVAAVRNALASFHDLDNAMAAGWNERLTPCLSSPDGGMGYHYGKVPFDASVDPLAPEALLYEPRGNGTLHLVAVEYIVPLPLSTTPPTLFGQTFHRNDGAGIWALHLWLFKPNPSGLFADWNPNVTCP